MKQLFLSMAVVGILIGFTAVALADERPILKPTPISDIFVPQGFDDNDNAEIVIHGYFPNTCYRLGPAKRWVDEKTRTIVVSAHAYYVPGICLQVMNRYWQPISLGILEAGSSYQIKIEQARTEIATLPVKKAENPGPDDFLYAPVREVSLDVENKKLVLKGIFSNDCTSLMEPVRVNEESTKVMAVLPIASFKDNGHCRSGEFPFSTIADLNPGAQGLYLIHVRSQNGMSFNRVEQLR